MLWNKKMLMSFFLCASCMPVKILYTSVLRSWTGRLPGAVRFTQLQKTEQVPDGGLEVFMR
jgi:hypothetical protein